MGFGEAVTSVLTQNYANFTGRARRSEYWWFYLAFVIAYAVELILFAISKPLGGILILITLLGVVVPNLAVGVRRLHDTGKSGWFLLIGLVPLVGGIVLLVFLCQDSEPDNQYGPNPKGLGGGYGPGHGAADAPYPPPPSV